VSPDGVRVVEIDDLIPRLYQDQIEAETASDRMAWFFNRESARRVEVAEAYGGFSHTAYRFNEQNMAPSPLTALLLPLLFAYCDRAGVPFKSLLRIRLGLFTNNPGGGPYHNPHVDFYMPHQNALYYVNDSDGDTFIFNESYRDTGNSKKALTIDKRVSPKKGKAILFDSNTWHASSNPRQNQNRIVLNLIFQVKP